MEKAGRFTGKLFAIAVLIAYVGTLTAFAITDDVVHGIWAILLSLSIRVIGDIKITKADE